MWNLQRWWSLEDKLREAERWRQETKMMMMMMMMMLLRLCEWKTKTPGSRLNSENTSWHETITHHSHQGQTWVRVSFTGTRIDGEQTSAGWGWTSRKSKIQIEIKPGTQLQMGGACVLSHVRLQTESFFLECDNLTFNKLYK